MLKAAKDSPAQGRRTPRTQRVLTASQPSVPRLQLDEEARPLSEAVPFCTVLPLANCDPLPLSAGRPEHGFCPGDRASNHHTHTSSIWSTVNTRGFPGGSVAKNPPAIQETGVLSLGQEDSLEKDMATHSSILAWEIPWTEEPGGLQSMGLQRVAHD